MAIYAPHISKAEKNAAAYPILMEIAEKMCDDNLDYYNVELRPLRNQLENEGKIMLVLLKSPEQNLTNGYGIVDMTLEEQLMLVLFAAEIARNGDLPYHD